MRSVWIVAFVLLAAGAFAGPVAAQSAAPSGDEAKCRALEGDHSTIQDAPSHVTAAKIIAAANGVPAHCDVQGYTAPNVGFALELPVANWNGRFLKFGCGGFCGGLLTPACDIPLKKGYACIVSDMGHKSTGLDAKWAYNNLEAEVDFAFRSTHVNALVGKALSEAFYGKAPAKSYYMGCSTGGRQGMVEAQRFPWDFDGIIAGAPVISETGDGMALAWNVRALHDAKGKPLFTPDELRKVHAAAIAKCDADDGVKDGLIGDPRTCRFDPASVPGLSAAQAEAVRKVYDGPRNAKGEATYTGGALPGSELNWIGNYIAPDGGVSVYQSFMGDLFRYMAFIPDPGPSWDLASFDFDRDYKRLGMMEGMYSGSNPDLRKFKAAGGKLMSYQGWADQSVLPLNVIDYYETAERTMGGRAATEAFFRLFMVPGMNHCMGGEGADAIDYLGAMEAWVEQGRAPDMMMAYHLKGGPGSPVARPEFPVDPANVAFSRPVYPYPTQARYKGGDMNDAKSFGPAKGK